jgi:hypothetical protein
MLISVSRVKSILHRESRIKKIFADLEGCKQCMQIEMESREAATNALIYGAKTIIKKP